jgi:hypothetical protein
MKTEWKTFPHTVFAVALSAVYFFAQSGWSVRKGDLVESWLLFAGGLIAIVFVVGFSLEASLRFHVLNKDEQVNWWAIKNMAIPYATITIIRFRAILTFMTAAMVFAVLSLWLADLLLASNILSACSVVAVVGGVILLLWWISGLLMPRYRTQ